MIESIRDDRDSTGGRVEPIDLVLQARSWTEVLHVAINCVCEVDILVLRVNGHVVQRVELATEVVVQKHWMVFVNYLFSVISGFQLDTYQSCCTGFSGS